MRRRLLITTGRPVTVPCTSLTALAPTGTASAVWRSTFVRPTVKARSMTALVKPAGFAPCQYARRAITRLASTPVVVVILLVGLPLALGAETLAIDVRTARRRSNRLRLQYLLYRGGGVRFYRLRRSRLHHPFDLLDAEEDVEVLFSDVHSVNLKARRIRALFAFDILCDLAAGILLTAGRRCGGRMRGLRAFLTATKIQLTRVWSRARSYEQWICGGAGATTFRMIGGGPHGRRR